MGRVWPVIASARVETHLICENKHFNLVMCGNGYTSPFVWWYDCDHNSTFATDIVPFKLAPMLQPFSPNELVLNLIKRLGRKISLELDGNFVDFSSDMPRG